VIVGSEGQDGRILFDRLVSEGWETTGIGRGVSRTSSGNEIGPVDLMSPLDVKELMSRGIDSVFYLAAYHHSSEQSDSLSTQELFARSWEVHVHGLTQFLDCLVGQGGSLFYASSSLVFGEPAYDPQDEATPQIPLTPYAITKAAGGSTCRYYRARHGVRASVGFLYNHESPLRAPAYVSQKIVRAAVRIASGATDKLVLGNLSAVVDWGYAPDFVDAMMRIAALPEPGDFIVATGEPHTVQEFVEIAFKRVGLDWREHVEEDPNVLARTAARRVGNAELLRGATGWSPSVSFDEMVIRLVDAARDGGH
jgi:GDPmannose 4,6-dehydratase